MAGSIRARLQIAGYRMTGRREESTEIRLRYLYRSLVLLGKASLSLESARRLVGPDCAYHLYGIVRAQVGRNNRARDGRSRRAR